MTTLQTEIEARLAASEPEVEVLLAEVVGGRTLRLFIDHPRGVTLDLCERVSHRLGEYRERYNLEVSSPGQDRPLTKPAHYARFLGRRARVRLRGGARRSAQGAAGAGRSAQGAAGAGRKGRGDRVSSKSVTGELVGATDEAVTIAAPDGIVTIAYAEITRSNLVPGD